MITDNSNFAVHNRYWKALMYNDNQILISLDLLLRLIHNKSVFDITWLLQAGNNQKLPVHYQSEQLKFSDLIVKIAQTCAKCL